MPKRTLKPVRKQASKKTTKGKGPLGSQASSVVDKARRHVDTFAGHLVEPHINREFVRESQQVDFVEEEGRLTTVEDERNKPRRHEDERAEDMAAMPQSPAQLVNRLVPMPFELDVTEVQEFLHFIDHIGYINQVKYSRMLEAVQRARTYVSGL